MVGSAPWRWGRRLVGTTCVLKVLAASVMFGSTVRELEDSDEVQTDIHDIAEARTTSQPHPHAGPKRQRLKKNTHIFPLFFTGS